MILNLENIGVDRSFKNAIYLASDDEHYYVRRTAWPKEVYMKFKYNTKDKQYLQRMYLIDTNCDLHETEIGWETCIGIDEVMAEDWEIWFATIA